MKHKWIIITLSVVFFLTALTFYANRVIFPTIIKKIAIEQAQNFLKRKVEIESLHFNWLKGVVINNIKIFQKGSSSEVFAQAQKISVAMIFIPGTKKHKLIFSSVTIDSPSLHLIHTKNDQWNFSDLLEAPKPNANEKPSPVDVSVGGINVVNGKLRLDDINSQRIWTELVDQINVKIGLSYQGISFDGSLLLPQKQGLISLNGSYWPVDQSLKASVNLKNIKPLDYLQLMPDLKLPVTIASGTLNEVNAHIDYNPNKIDLQGQCSLKHIDLDFQNQLVKADVDISNAHVTIAKDLTSVKGLFNLANVQVQTPALSLKGSLKADIDHFTMKSPEDISVKGSLQTDVVHVTLSGDRAFEGQISAKIENGRWQKDSGNFEGSFNIAQALLTLNDEQNIKMDLKLNDIKANKNKDSINASATLNLPNLDVRLPGQVIKGSVSSPHLTFGLEHQNILEIIGPLDIINIDATTEKIKATGALHLKNIKANFDQTKKIAQVHTQGNLQDIQVKLEGQGSLSTNTHFDLHATYPLDHPDQLQYNGSIAIADTRYEGLAFGPVKDINLTADFKTNQADIQNLTLNVLDTPIKASGQITNFAKPLVNVEIESQKDFDLSKIKDVAPDLLKSQGLTIDGTASFKLKFDGPASDPLTGTINANAVIKNTNIQSSVLKQSFKDISATINAQGDSLSWDDLSVTIMEHPLTSKGHLDNFKNPKVNASLSWQDIQVTAQIDKNDNTVSINDFSAQYQTASLHARGTVELGKVPQLDVKADAKFKLDDLAVYAPNLRSTVEPMGLAGWITATAAIVGPVTDWKNLTTTAVIESDVVKAYKLKFKNIKATINQTGAKLKDSTINCDFYSGAINVISNIDLTSSQLPSDISLKVDNVDVATLIKDLNVVQDIRGKFNLTTNLNVSLMKALEVNGKGSVAIKEAYLADIDLFKGLLTPLRMILPNFSNLILNEVSGNFAIANQKVTTNDLQLKGNLMNFISKGNVGFDQSIEMSVEAPDEYNEESAIPADIRQSIHYSIHGTLTKPVIEHHFSEIKTMLNIGKKILGDKVPSGISNILDQLPF